MKIVTLIITILFFNVVHGFSQNENLISNGDFNSLQSWKSNDNLLEKGKVTLLPNESGVMIYNPMIDVDGYLYQQISAAGIEWLSYSAKIKAGKVLSCAAISFVAFDQSGKELSTMVPFSDFARIYETNWKFYSGKIRLPANTREVRILLAVLDGECSFANVTVNKSDGTDQISKINPISAPARIVDGKGFSVKAIPVERPFWELFSDDLNGDGKPEIIACDVGGVVTIRNEGNKPFLTYKAGALVYQFESADLNGDGAKELLMSSIDPKIAVIAIDLKGNLVRTFDQSRGQERMEAADINRDGFPEIAISKRNGVQGSGIAGGVILYSSNGEKLWEKDEILREFHFADINPESGIELVVGGPLVNFRVYGKDGNKLDSIDAGTTNLEHFILADIDQDGKIEIIASNTASQLGMGVRLLCVKEKSTIWEIKCPPMLGSGSASTQTLIANGDFYPEIKGLETVMVGTHNVFLFDVRGNLIYQNTEDRKREYWEKFVPGGINSLDIACWNNKDPHLYLSSSRFRDSAYYKLTYGDRDELRTYLVPDQEKNLDDIYITLKKQPSLAVKGKEKIKILIDHYSLFSEETIRKYKHLFDSIGSPNIEYLIINGPSDLKGHYEGIKLTTDMIAEKAALFEKVGQPFGYFIAHSGRTSISEEAIRRSAENAPAMFRFLYMCEDLETLYDPMYKDFLAWLDKTLALCAKYKLKLILREKHDAWGFLPADPEIAKVLFRPEYRNVIVPMWSSNQPYEPEVQLGGLLGLKMEGLCNEFGMSAQYWNWHEWGRYPRGIRDISPTSVCPSDIILRLELMGLALGGTWIQIEGGQPYLREDISKGFAPMATRHRELAYELIRKNVITPGATPVNLNKTTIVRSLHQEILNAKTDYKRIAYPYYNRNTEILRKGFIPARYFFETYPAYAFPLLAYSSAWNVSTCFPTTPNGWIPIIPPLSKLSPERTLIQTDGEKILINNQWVEADKGEPYVKKMLSNGAADLPLEAPGTCLIIQKDDSKKGVYTAIMIDPGYLAPVGVLTTLKSRKGNIKKATDMVSGESLTISGNSCPLEIRPGAFRIIKIELTE